MKDSTIQSILFVCLGNICRSPLAQGIARHIAQQHNLNIEIDSAGTSGWHIDEQPCAGSRYIAKEHGFSIDDLRGRRVSAYADEKFDLIIALDRSNYADLLTLGFEKNKVKKLEVTILSRVCCIQTSFHPCLLQENSLSHVCPNKTPSNTADFPKKS